MSYVIIMATYGDSYPEEGGKKGPDADDDNDADVNDVHPHPNRCHPAGIEMCQSILNNMFTLKYSAQRVNTCSSILTQTVFFSC